MQDENVSAGLYKFKEKVTSISAHLKYLEMVLSGHRWTGHEDDYIYTGEVLASSEVISTAVSLLTPYTHESNLITVKDPKAYARQIFFTKLTFLGSIKKMGLRSDNAKEIIDIFFTTLENVGDIILSSKGLIEQVIGEQEKVGLT